jgi:hypothetical protein
MRRLRRKKLKSSVDLESTTAAEIPKKFTENCCGEKTIKQSE